MPKFELKMGFFRTAFLLAQVLLFPVFHTYPTGAPTTACSTLTPVHRENVPQQTRSPYTVTTTKIGDKIRVTISSPDGEDFRGFVMQARSARDKQRIVEGRFTTEPGISRTIDCNDGRQNTITQVNKNSKTHLDTEWTPSPGINEDLIFRATVAKTFQYFWTEVDSAPLWIGSKGSGVSEKQNKESNTENMYDNCFVSKGCLGYPGDCITKRNCDFLLTYTDAGDGVLFTMSGSLGTNNYMASALSYDNKMGDDAVTECFIENGRVLVQNSWNGVESNAPKTRVPDGLYQWGIKNGIASCSWTKPYLTIVEGRMFDMANSTYYLLLAKGPMISGGRVGYHNGRLHSQESVNFTAYELIESEGAHDAVKVHGDSLNGTESDADSSSRISCSINLLAIVVSCYNVVKYLTGGFL